MLFRSTRLPEGRRSRRPEVDHIFPKSKLAELKTAEDRINHYANFRLISQPENNWKRAQDPQPYFKNNPRAAARYYIPEDLLDYSRYEQFLEKRKEKIWARLDQFFGLNSSREKPNEPEKTIPVETTLTESNHPPKPAALLTYCREILASTDASQPALEDNARWWDIMPDWYGQIWRRNYAASLERQGVWTVGDLVALISALKLKINYVEEGYPNISFAGSGPDGQTVKIERFKLWGWRMVLMILEQHNFDWRAHVINPEILSQVRNPLN